ncbi:hypothetical protein LHYA1_G003335 [Lachnellula hyalina]|uniref:NADH dehydrogenase [ubiquinone] 1 beta subcomplex subunit 11, mitochondrial n=1 Tax=Lachnellula hyalina TaxID=1316788 RepID=A0A8H8R5Q7_9HELO|nr:uncharacterized protein LHYA1_G003335 [Lachnellula hyalina]TVY28220.1 hypothetical protein LHYA1_G003335 [Lachnellula hyalina]
MRVLPTPTTALRASRSLTCSASACARSSSARPFSASASSASAAKAGHADAHEHEHEHHHEEPYDPPTGWLFGVKPGEKAPVEGWENIWVYGFFGSLAAGAVGYAFKPDTSIQTWALEEARRRLEVEGILAEPEDKS